jgi:predicted alpha/beta hydrolase family esterase
MPRRPTRTVPTVLLHGVHGREADGWQSWLAGQLSDADREVRFPSLGEPDLTGWLAALDDSLRGLPDDGFDVIAHSLSCLAWLHHAAAAEPGPRPARVALVAPPSAEDSDAAVAAGAHPGYRSFYPAPVDIDAVRRAADGTVLVGSDNDPHCPGGVARVYGVPLKMAATVIPGAGSIDAAAGFGPWPAVLDWCGRDNLAFIA